MLSEDDALLAADDLDISDWQASDFIIDEDDVASYLDAVLAKGDLRLLLSALGDVARSEGMTKISRKCGISRDGLYKALREDGNPSLDTIVKVLGVLGLRLSIVPAQGGPVSFA